MNHQKKIQRNGNATNTKKKEKRNGRGRRGWVNKFDNEHRTKWPKANETKRSKANVQNA